MADEKPYWEKRVDWWCPACCYQEQTDGRILSHSCPKCLHQMKRLESQG